MPSRERQKLAATEWTVFFLDANEEAEGKSDIKKACRASNGQIEVATSYPRCMLLRWRDPVKYDVAMRFTVRRSMVEGGASSWI
jgi:hypothetical protein